MMLKATDVARIMNCSPASAYELMHELGPVRFGSRGIRLQEEVLNAYIAGQARVKPRPHAREPVPENLQQSLEKAQRPSDPPPPPKEQPAEPGPVRARPRAHAARKIPDLLQRALEKARRPSDPPPRP